MSQGPLGNDPFARRIEYGSFWAVKGGTSHPTSVGLVYQRALNSGGTIDPWNFLDTDYNRCLWTARFADREVTDLRFTKQGELVDWVNANVPNSGGAFDYDCRFYVYDEIDSSITPIRKLYGKNSLYGRLRARTSSPNFNRYWSGGLTYVTNDIKWDSHSPGALDTMLDATFQGLFGTSIAPLDDKRRAMFWFVRNHRRLYYMPKYQTASSVLNGGSGARFAWDGANPVPNPGGGWQVANATAVVYPTVDASGNYVDTYSMPRMLTHGFEYLRSGYSSLVAIGLTPFGGASPQAVLLKPMGVDSFWTNSFDEGKYRLEAVTRERIDSWTRMRIWAPGGSNFVNGDTYGPFNLSSILGATLAVRGSYFGHSVQPGPIWLRLRDLTTGRVSALSSAFVDWFRAQRYVPLAPIVKADYEGA